MLTSCIPLSSSTKVIFPDIIFFSESLNSLSCSRVSFLVSSYSSVSSSSLKYSGHKTKKYRVSREEKKNISIYTPRFQIHIYIYKKYVGGKKAERKYIKNTSNGCVQILLWALSRNTDNLVFFVFFFLPKWGMLNKLQNFLLGSLWNNGITLGKIFN